MISAVDSSFKNIQSKHSQKKFEYYVSNTITV